MDVTSPNPYLHDFENIALEHTRDVYDQNANVQLFEKKIYSTSNDTSIVLTQRYNDSISAYEDWQRSVTVVDSKGQRIYGGSEEWDGTMWQNLSGFKTQRTYNGNKETETESQQFNSLTKQYENYSKAKYKFTRPIGLQELNFNWSIGPNPANNRLNIEVAEGADLTISVYDMQGRAVIGTTRFSSSGVMDLSQLPVGTYVLEVKGENNTRQILKQLISR